MALVENMAREDLNPVEEARACAALVEELGLSKEEVGRRVGRSRSAISNLIRLLDLPDQVLALLEAGELSEGHGRAMLQVRGRTSAAGWPARRRAGGWSVRETESRAKGGRGGGGGEGCRRPDPEEEAAIGRPRTRSRRRSAARSSCGLRGGRAARPRSASRTSTSCSRWPDASRPQGRLTARPSRSAPLWRPDAAAIIGRQRGRLAQSVRALL